MDGSDEHLIRLALTAGPDFPLQVGLLEVSESIHSVQSIIYQTEVEK
jgi:hypothetical protein